ncbi:hypothetical protein BH23GEM11_BH23GEM11_04170 [soil metagenome]
MTAWDVVVIVGAIAAIAWVNWYFFLAAADAPAGAPAPRDGDGDPAP